jgi:hypothetical protein
MMPGQFFLARSNRDMLKFHNTPQNGNTDIYRISSSIIDGLRERAGF